MSTSPAEPERPTRPALSREFILRTALRIVDDEGPDKLTMRHLGAVLGVDPMAVYHYLPNKAALFDGIVETIWSFIGPASIPTEGGWRQRLAGAMHSFRDVLRQHPRAVAILGTRPIWRLANLAAWGLTMGGAYWVPLVNSAGLCISRIHFPDRSSFVA